MPDSGRPFIGTGLAALAALARADAAHILTGVGLAGDPALSGARGGGLATALGLALGGERVTLFLTDRELAASAALAREAVLRRVPLCICLASGTLGGARHAAEAGMTVLLPGTVGEAVDHAVAARLATESALTPVVVALDGPTLAFSVQNAALPTPELLDRLLGRPADSVHAADVAERELFGEHRRRIPRWHDSSRARMLGGELGAPAARAALAAERSFFARNLARQLDGALAKVAAATGRPLPAVAGRRLARHDLGLIASGGFAETAQGVARELERSRCYIGVVALRRLAPLPESELLALVHGSRKLAVLERLDRPGESGVLAEAVRAALARAGVAAEVATLGVVGDEASLAAADLAAGCRALDERFRPLLLLGLATQASADYPKRQALHDEFRRALPAWDDLASPSDRALDLRPPGSVTVRFDRLAGDAALARDAGHLLGNALGGHLHSRLALAAPAAGLPERDWLIWAPTAFADPGEPPAADLAFHFVRPPAGAERERFLGALTALVARGARRDVKERAVRAAFELRLAASPALAAATDDERAALLAALLAGFAEPELAAHPQARGEMRASLPAPPARGFGWNPDGGSPGDPMRFWDQIGLPIAEGLGEELLPDLTLALGAMPAGSAPVGAALFGGRPAFLPERCTGCAACWTACPHSAIEVNAQPIERLLEAGIAAAGRAGRSAEALRRFVRKLAERLAFAAATRRGGKLGDWLASAGGEVLATAGLSPERLAEANAGLSQVTSEIGAVQLAATETFYFSANGGPLPGGALLTLAVDPDRCTGCGLCVAECAPGALVGARVSPQATTAAEHEALAAERAALAAMRKLPPAENAAVERAAGDARLGALAAALMRPEGVLPLAGFDRAAPGSAPRLAVRQALALLARALAPCRAAQGAELRTLGERLAEAIHGTLGQALPDRDLEALGRGLEATGGGAIDLGELAGRLAGAVASARVDVGRLGRLVETARAVADLAARLGGSDDSAGPLFTVVVGPGEALAWARRFPDNPFGVPATVAQIAPLAVARGLAVAEAERALAVARVLRRARLELERPQEALLARETLAALAWDDLEASERALAAPLVVLLDETAGGDETGEALALLAAAVPVAIVTLAAAPGREPRPAWWAVAAAAEEGIVAHASIAETRALASAMTAFAAGGRGALVRLLAPRAGSADVRTDFALDRARGVVEAREFPIGCRIAAAASTPTAPRVDPFAVETVRRAEHAGELAALAERHRGELAGLEAELRLRLAERARARLLEIAARGYGAGAGHEGPEAR